ncbi:hypothetical protein [Mesorhizobium marinum]|uniref:Uncharacterized protein n=1 Tax=Mesorhizobium marinum TaxID=3228790 RepID=A0ABV3QZP1_9HYPH
MGNPTHFSLEVPKRAHQLLQEAIEEVMAEDLGLDGFEADASAIPEKDVVVE